MSTEVLLMADVAELGAEGDVVSVADGYARNYLYPMKFAAPVTQATKRKLVKMQQDREKKRQLQLEAARELAVGLEKVSCTIAVKVAEGNKLYGSVSSADIVENLKTQGVKIDKSTIALDAPIRELGIFDIKVKLHPEVEGTVRVWVVEE